MDLGAFDSFWEILDTLLNSILYVILGVSFIRIMQMPNVIILSVFAVACNLIARYGSLYLSTFFMGTLPDGLSKSLFSGLFTWGGLRGGLSIALAMSTMAIIPEADYRIILGCTYAIVFFTTVVQGLSIKRLFAEKLAARS
jgi:CPA1 family monovalent cation:H+ antiporter